MDCFIAADCEAFCERKTPKPVVLNWSKPFYVQMKVTVIVSLKILLIFSATDKR